MAISKKMAKKRSNKKKLEALIKKGDTKKLAKLIKTGGFLPLLPLLGPIIAGIGSLAGGAAGIASAVTKAKNEAKILEELKKRNKEGSGRNKKKRGKGLYLKRGKV